MFLNPKCVKIVPKVSRCPNNVSNWFQIFIVPNGPLVPSGTLVPRYPGPLWCPGSLHICLQMLTLVYMLQYIYIYIYIYILSGCETRAGSLFFHFLHVSLFFHLFARKTDKKRSAGNGKQTVRKWIKNGPGLNGPSGLRTWCAPSRQPARPRAPVFGPSPSLVNKRMNNA